mgnify:FL=1
MKNPIPILSIWTIDYILNHAAEMQHLLSGRNITVIQDMESKSPYDKPSINKNKVYTIVEVRPNKAQVRDEDGDVYTYAYKSLALLDITAAELDRAIETQKSYILNAEMEIQKFSDWKGYMQENYIKVFNVNSFNANYLLEMFKQVQSNKADLTVDELKKIVSTITGE